MRCHAPDRARGRSCSEPVSCADRCGNRIAICFAIEGDSVIMERRRFIAKASGAITAVAAAAVVDAPNVIAQPKFKWRMPTTWPPTLDVLLGSAQRLATLVEEMSA